LDVSGRSLNAQSQVIRVIGDNIANVNTPGYSRRTAQLVSTQSSGTANLRNGTGVEVQSIVRNVDDFLNKQYLSRISDRSSADIRQQYLTRAEEPFTLDQSPGHIDYQLTQFFSSLQDLETNPADTALREQVLQAGRALTSAISDTYNSTAALQREADNRIADNVTTLNSLTSQIASINQQIVSGETPTQQNLTLRDTRDELLRKVAELAPIQTLELANGQVQVTLSNGFALVNGGTAQTLTYTPSPDFTAPQQALDGGPLGYITYDFNPGAAGGQSDLTGIFAAGGGEISGLLRVRGVPNNNSNPDDPFSVAGDLPQVAARVEWIARDLLTRFNTTYRGYDGSQFPEGNLGGAAPGGTLPGDEDPATPAVFDPSSGSLNDIPTPTNTNPGVFGLFSLSGSVTATDVNSDGMASVNDLLSSGGGDPGSFASRISFAVTDQAALATALDLDPAANSREFSPGDAQNIANLLALRNKNATYSIGGVNGYTATSTIEDVYRQTVTYVGSASSTAQSEFKSQEARESQVKELYSSVSGVSIDEELAKLINFQRAFQASARMIKTGDDLYQEIIDLLR
jgi:flagellar hook-associated protein 1 FlgK